jgi:hypothetical protein
MANPPRVEATPAAECPQSSFGIVVVVVVVVEEWLKRKIGRSDRHRRQPHILLPASTSCFHILLPISDDTHAKPVVCEQWSDTANERKGILNKIKLNL